MKKNQGFDEPNIIDNDTKTIRRTTGELVGYINRLLNRIIDLEDRVKTLES